ncbi:hypothetical protein QN386_05570 [Pseudomonas sp. CCI3.2]|uniref:hypothetical protein n=1 Tax=unclassified Pseudomonas TaxID=196821 RepID=UPI002AC8DF28|nr:MULTISPECIES: hypothetical protein [unclassified Pseudomonas]MEB0076398.1 hypothetical protein [Pseudomonas sp. MH10out]MEB0091253.1 hypothetical protein [Pseudomonas sp. CCI4.2]MEB0100793.1 hypothetical protein [Pseudomonas sp. CCI3.2]MEB0128822.1 hypothetical protein [Pseudomonas sp. CCI2.4]MEB0156951.1 hypothetical protein [Pseudomonas sp. AH2 (2023)]
MKRRYWFCLALLTVWGADVARSWYEREIVVEIGGTYEHMRQQSSARFSPPYPDGGISWGGAKSNARLRFVDPQYGFITPIGTHFTMGFRGNIIEDIRISPQIEPLLLEDALKVVLDLQEQWRRGGWLDKKKFPPFADTPQWRAQLRDKGGTTDWYAGDKYQAMLIMHRFKDRKHPEEERYKIILSVAKPWTPYP